MTPTLKTINDKVGLWIGIDDNSIDCAVFSPPYFVEDGYSLSLMTDVGDLLHRVLKPGARAFMNFGQVKDGFARPLHAALEVRRIGLEMCQTIAWIKAISIDGAPVRGHVTPLNSDHLLNYSWEYVFTYVKGRPPGNKLDRLSVGVPYAYKSNLTRGSRGKNGDLRCAGDTWFVPYPTTGKTDKKAHRHSYPEGLVTRCLKLAGLKPGQTVLDPFSGGGTTAVAAKKLGLNCVAIDRDPEAIKVTTERWEATSVNLTESSS